MSGSKKRSGFQITSVTSDINHTPGKQVPPSALLSIVQAAVSSGSSSQPTTPTSKRKFVSHDTSGHGAGCSRFRVVRLAVGGAGGNRRGEPYSRGRWTCTDFLELKEGTRFKRLMDTMRHAHSLDSLQMIGREPQSGRDPTHRHTNPVRGRDGPGLTLHSGPPSPTHQEPISLHLLHSREETDSPPLLPPPRPRILPPPLRLDVDASGRSVLRLSHSQPSSPPAGWHHHPMQSPAAFSLDNTIFHLQANSSSTTNLMAIDNKIEQAMDLVKSHLMLAVREEVELLREQIKELQEKNQHLERENTILRTLSHANTPHTQHDTFHMAHTKHHEE